MIGLVFIVVILYLLHAKKYKAARVLLFIGLGYIALVTILVAISGLSE